VPVWVGNYVLMGYGDGAVMGVPAHDERDFAFALKYGCRSCRWCMSTASTSTTTAGRTGTPTSSAASPSTAATTAACRTSRGGRHRRGAAGQGPGREEDHLALRDWGISRQRYWGTPIPIIHCDSLWFGAGAREGPAGAAARRPGARRQRQPAEQVRAFLHVACPQCGKPARRETDTMDTFVDSAWYYMRYCCPDSDGAMVDARNDYWMPMDQYIGGIEHAVLHLLYARFWTKAMRDLGLVKFGEPFTKLFTQGMLLNECFYRETKPARSAGSTPARSRSLRRQGPPRAPPPRPTASR
jgi:leucyl-tRNA synthetase